jgi:thiamine-phosphate pyrophosphorylase
MVAAYARQTGRLFIVNDHLDIAMAAGADGVHLGQADLPLVAVRRVWGPGHLVGRSTHSLEQARAAAAEGADYIGIGPVFATPTKPGRPAVGLELLRPAASELAIPWFAIGGIDSANLAQVLAAGASRVAVVRAVSSAADPAEAAAALLARLGAPMVTA